MVTHVIDFLVNFVTGTISQIGYLGVFVLMIFESACVPIPSEIIMPFSGFLASTGKLNIYLITFFGALGNLVGAVITYLIGFYGGRPFILKWGKFFFVKEKEVHQAEKFFARWGDFAVFLARNFPIVRTFISLPAGVAEMNFPKFAIYSFLGSIPWCFALTYLGFILGKNWMVIRKYGDILDVIVGIAIVAFLGKIIYDYYNSDGNPKTIQA